MFLVVASGSFTANAKNIHWITTADTADSLWGKTNSSTVAVIDNKFASLVQAATDGDYTFTKHNLIDDVGNSQYCAQYIGQIETSPDDAIILFISGGHNTLDKEMLVSALKASACRLTVAFIVDRSATDRNMALPLDSPITLPAPIFSLEADEKKTIANLFTNTSGNFILTAATTGSPLYTTGTNLGEIDLYASILTCNFSEMAYNGSLGWENLCRTTAMRVKELSGGKQIPEFLFSQQQMSAIPDIDSGNVQQNHTTTPAQETSDVSGEIMGLLKSSLDFLTDHSNSAADRMNVAASLEVLFTPEAAIKIVGTNNFIVRENPKEFLGRVSTSTLVTKIEPLDLKIEQNKDAGFRQISQLIVKEHIQNR